MVEDIVLGSRGREDFIESELVFVELDLGLGVCQYALLLRVGLYPNEDLDGVLAWIWVHWVLGW